MTRTDLQRIALAYLEAAKSLIQSAHWGPAYYLAGYAVECGLKACIARQVRENDFPDFDIVKASYTHKLPDLMKVAGLAQQLNEAMASSDELKVNWTTVKDWSAESRYKERDEVDARGMIGAIEGKPNGVLEWVMQRW